MKNISTIILIFISFITYQSFGSNANLFQYDANKIDQELQELNQLEKFIDDHGKATYLELQESGNNLIAHVSSTTDGMRMFGLEPAMGIPSFLWGFCFGLVGILVVYLVTEDGDETKKAVWGCAAAGACYAVVYVIYIVWLASIYTIY